MNKLVIALTVALAGAALVAADKPKLTPEQKEAKRVSRNGNFLFKPGTQKGKLAFIVTQDEVPFSAFQEMAKEQADELLLNIVCEKAAKGDPATLKANAKADVAVIVVADDTTPSLLVSVDDGWAVVNVRKMTEGLKTPEAVRKFHAKRCQRQALRALVAAGGGFSSAYPGNILSIKKLSDLDLCETFIPNDASVAMETYLSARGVTPAKRVRYRRACQEGWAPAPTNDIQRTIWKEVHEMPSAPLKIEYKEKRDKGK